MNTEVRVNAPQPVDMLELLPRYSRASGLGRVRWVASSNESTIPPSSAVQAAVAEATAHGNHYPSLFGEELAHAIAERFELGDAQVVVGPGSLALLQQALIAFTGAGTEVVYGWRSYEAYPMLVTLAGAKSVQVPLDDAHRYDVDGLIAAVGPNTRSLIICNPNNPTGTMLTQEEVQRILDAVPKHVLVILDEAYREFTDADHDAVGWITEYSNLAIMRTFSKAYGLAGLRAGYLISNAGLSAAVQRTLPPFSLSATASAAALAAWNDLEHTAKIVDIASQERDRLQSNLRALGVDTPPSGGNFVWISAPTSARRLEELCVHEGVAVRAFDDAGVRITTGNADASDACVRAVTALIAERGSVEYL
ncbi:histidinol-phosphate transaminase [Garicola koreensis]|uniref:aminotransferase class I/II-fold pyridoxal phosphate-dependent enzyme n=1 Tax=Garicola koreensis TaxID=1262554 RepID=UPI0031E75455